MAAGTNPLVAILRDARIFDKLRSALLRMRLMGLYRYEWCHGNAAPRPRFEAIE
jgi:hypothetical protein